MKISITDVHLDLGAGRRGTDMGPSAMHVAGLVPKLSGMGHEVVDVQRVRVRSHEASGVGDERARYLDVITACCAEIADRVEAALHAGHFPLVLGGDHAQAVGTISGLARYGRSVGERYGVVWVDAHTDMNTPETSPSGNVHGMPLAVLLGHGPQALVDIAGSEPALRPQDVCVIGARDLDLGEVALVRELKIGVYPMSELDRRGTAVCVAEAMDRVLADTDGVHLSFDLDGIDPQDAPGVGTPVPGGLTIRESHLICEAASWTRKLVGMEMVELNPTLDVRNKTGELAVWLIQSALGKQILGSDV